MFQNNAMKQLGDTHLGKNKNTNKAKVTFFDDYKSKEKEEESDPEISDENEMKFNFV